MGNHAYAVTQRQRVHSDETNPKQEEEPPPRNTNTANKHRKQVRPFR